MDKTKPIPKILLYGNSILIESLTSRLQHQGWEVKQTAGGDVDGDVGVDFIVADLCDVATSQALPMLCALPGIMLIGADAIANTLTVLTGRSHLASGMEEVLDALREAM